MGNSDNSDRNVEPRIQQSSDASRKHSVRTHDAGPITVIRLVDRKLLDETCIHELGEELLEEAQSKPLQYLVLDLSEVNHMSSSAFGMLIVLHKRLRERAGKLALACVPPGIYEVLAITRMNSIFHVFPTVDAATASLSR